MRKVRPLFTAVLWLAIAALVVFACLVQTQSVGEFLGLSFLASRAVVIVSFGIAILLSAMGLYISMSTSLKETVSPSPAQPSNKTQAAYRPSFTFIGILLGFVVSFFLPANPGIAGVEPGLLSFVMPSLIIGALFGTLGGLFDLVVFVKREPRPTTAGQQSADRPDVGTDTGVR